MASFEEQQKNQENRSYSFRNIAINIVAYLHDLSYLVAAMMILFLVFFRVVVVSGPSMNNTLINGDYLLLVSSTLYSEPKQGDIIVASKDSFEDGIPIVKRVIATEGQTVDIIDGVVYVDGIALDEPYAMGITRQNGGTVFPLTVEEGYIFVMGDNREVSMDSRNPLVGLLDRREILGKAFFLFLPGENYANIRDFTRIGGLH